MSSGKGVRHVERQVEHLLRTRGPWSAKRRLEKGRREYASHSFAGSEKRLADFRRELTTLFHAQDTLRYYVHVMQVEAEGEGEDGGGVAAAAVFPIDAPVYASCFTPARPSVLNSVRVYARATSSEFSAVRAAARSMAPLVAQTSCVMAQAAADRKTVVVVSSDDKGRGKGGKSGFSFFSTDTALSSLRA